LNNIVRKKNNSNSNSNLKFVYSDNDSVSVIFQNNDLLMGVVGEFNENLKELEKITKTSLYFRGNSILIKSSPDKNEIIKNGNPLQQIITDLDLGHVSDEGELSDIISQILNEEIKAVEEAKQNPEIVNFLVGKVMKKTRGKAAPELTLSLLKKHLGID